jgi:hypothetical protein
MNINDFKSYLHDIDGSCFGKQKLLSESKIQPKSGTIVSLPTKRLQVSTHVPLTIAESSVHGVGVFATKNIPANTSVCLYMESMQTGYNDYIRTDVARLTNHSTSPNVVMEKSSNDDLHITTSNGIRKGEEVFVNYFEVSEAAQPRNILKDTFIRLMPSINEDTLQDPEGIDFYADLEYLSQLENDTP